MSNKITIAAQVICYLNGSPLGQVTGFHWTSNTGYKPQFGLDSVIPVELTPTTTSVTGTVSILSIPATGNLEGLGITAPFQNLLNTKYFTIALRDELYGTTFFQASYCVVDSQTWGAEAKGIVTGQFQFTGMIWNNEVPVVEV